MTININELRRLAQAAIPGPDGVSLNWIKLLQDFQQGANPAAINELLDRIEMAEQGRDALLSRIEAMEKQKPAGTLHDDGCFVWSTPRPYDSNYAGWKMKLYLAPGAKGEEK